MNKDFLIEIGCEELPPMALKKLSDAFANEMQAALKDFRLDGFEIIQYAAPRRLALWIKNIPVEQTSESVEKRGPALANAYDDEGKPSKAAEGFARSNGVTVDQLEKLETDQGTYLAYKFTQEGQQTEGELLAMVETALSKLPIPKRMRWGDGDAEFVRPVHWILALFGGDLVEGSVMGIKTTNQTFGHRFHAPVALSISKADDYESELKSKGFVIADLAARKTLIEKQINEITTALKGKVDFEADADLLDEVSALNEWPVALTGSFDDEFLEIPSEAVVTSMKEHQKYFPVFDQSGKLTKHFITVSNIDSKDMSQVREGNERVIRPRLADAKFFWQQDKKQTLEAFNSGLAALVYHKKLGSVQDKVNRVKQLATSIAKSMNANADQVARAAELAKADLNTEMVGEFPKLQGVMGKYYALESKEDVAVAAAIEDHYKPRYSGDALPLSAESQALALADRLDTLVGIFAAGEKPSGAKDPYGLRRASIAILRIIIDKELNLDLETCLQESANQFASELKAEAVVSDVFDYIMSRLKSEYQPEFSPQQIDSVLSTRPTKPLDFEQRLKAVAVFSKMPEAESLSAANKRIGNLLKKAGDKQASAVSESLFEEEAEKVLYAQLQKVLPEVDTLSESGDYEKSLSLLSTLKDKVDSYFDSVMVMADDEKVKQNRLATLASLHKAFVKIADIAKLQK